MDLLVRNVMLHTECRWKRTGLQCETCNVLKRVILQRTLISIYFLMGTKFYSPSWQGLCDWNLSWEFTRHHPSCYYTVIVLVFVIRIDACSHICYDMIWRHGMMWYDVWYMTWYEMKWYDMIWWHGMIWYDDMVWCDMMYDMIWYEMKWYDMVWWHGIWYDMI